MQSSNASFTLMPGESDGQTYQCTTCGSSNIKVLRQDKDNPRLRCNSCNFVFNGRDSLEAQEAGALTSSKETLANAEEPHRETLDKKPRQEPHYHPSEAAQDRTRSVIPRNPNYVFIPKDRRNSAIEYCTAKEAQKVALRWHEVKHDVYELVPKKFDVQVNIS